MTSTHEERRAFLAAIKGAIRAPAKTRVLIKEYERQLWQWLWKAEDAGRGAARTSAVVHTQCAVKWQQTRQEMVSKVLVAESARLLLLSSGGDVTSQPVPSPGGIETPGSGTGKCSTTEHPTYRQSS